METVNINYARSGEILIWDGKVAMWKNMSDVESERLRKERKQKLEKINALQSIIQ